MKGADKYHELSFYTLSLQDEEFIHQHVVDAYAAQTADAQTKNIGLFLRSPDFICFSKKAIPANRCRKHI